MLLKVKHWPRSYFPLATVQRHSYPYQPRRVRPKDSLVGTSRLVGVSYSMWKYNSKLQYTYSMQS